MVEKTAKKYFAYLASGVLGFLAVFPFLRASAHEAYVLPASEFQKGLQMTATNPLGPLLDSAHLGMFVLIGALVIISYLLVLLWSGTKPSDVLDAIVRKAAVVGPLIIRIAISASFFYSAMNNVILGPELPLSGLPFGNVIRLLLFLLSLMILTGTLTEIAAAIGIALYAYACAHFGVYMITYTNYLGELLVLFLFGSRFLSFDKLFFGGSRWWKKAEGKTFLETPIVRILYGVALIYAGYTIKFLHQGLTIDVYNQYHLADFFHASAGFIAAGAGVSEILIGLFILIGFGMRWTILISLVFITLSILYFQELLWPHFMLYGISFSLLINSSDRYTLDSKITPWVRCILHRTKTA